MKKQEMKVFTMYEGWDAEKEKPNRSTLVENPEKMLEKQFWLFSYEERDPLTRQAKAIKIQI